MEWIKKNWMGLTIALLAILVVVYYYNSKAPSAEKKIYLTPAQRKSAVSREKGQNLSTLKEALVTCQKEYSSVKISSTTIHPCDDLQKQVDSMQKATA